MSAEAPSTAASERVPPRELADWLLARGRHWVTTAEAASILNLPPELVPPTLARQQRKALLFSPTRGAYVPIPPQFREWRAVPASHFVDDLMRHLGHPYYVALLSAAEVHGVAHQRPQVFQVMTTARLDPRTFGRVQIRFLSVKDTPDRPVTRVNTPTGTMAVSTPEVTALDLVRFPGSGGGLSNAATVLAEMAEESLLSADVLATVAAGYPRAVTRRTGWLLDFVCARTGTTLDLSRLRELADPGDPNPTLLAPRKNRAGERDPVWNVIVNTDVEPDV